MPITKKDVERIAELAHLQFSDEELEPFTVHFQEILDYITALESVNTDDIEPMNHALLQPKPETPMRDDVVGESLEPALAVREAPDSEENQFRVPKVIE